MEWVLRALLFGLPTHCYGGSTDIVSSEGDNPLSWFFRNLPFPGRHSGLVLLSPNIM